MKQKLKKGSDGESFKNLVVKYYGCKKEGAHAAGAMSFIIIRNHGKEWKYKIISSEFEKELKKIGFLGVRDFCSEDREKRDERIRKFVALKLYGEPLESEPNPVDIEYQYELLKDDTDVNLDQKSEEKIEEWTRMWEELEFDGMVKNNKRSKTGNCLRGKNNRRAIKGNSLRGIKGGTLKEDLEGVIGYCLFWEEKGHDREIGKIDSEFKENLENEDFDIYLKKALKDIGMVFRVDVEINKIGKGKWELIGSERSRKSYEDKKRIFVDEEEDELRVFEHIEPNKRRTIDKEITIECNKDLEFLRDFPQWDEKGEWKEDKNTIKIKFQDFKRGSGKKNKCENMLYRCFRLYDLKIIEDEIKIKFDR